MRIEMHAHVLYGVDDGPKTCEEMYQMLYAAAESGVERVYCTSHLKSGRKNDRSEVYMSRLNEARQWCAANAPQMELYSGCELLYSDAALQLLNNGSALALGDTNLVLLEFYPDVSRKTIMEALERFRNSGWQVILAHVERYRHLRSLKSIQEARNVGNALVQVNAQSVFDEHASFLERRRMRRMIGSGLVDFVASDAHDSLERSFCLQYAYRYLKKNFGMKTAKQLCGDRFLEIAEKSNFRV